MAARRDFEAMGAEVPPADLLGLSLAANPFYSPDPEDLGPLFCGGRS